jgi:hypothetical protein
MISAMTRKIQETVLESARIGEKSIQSAEYMPSGTNGPWNDDETPVRNTSHWGITLAYAANITDEDKFLKAAERCSSYLISDQARPYGETFYHRRSHNKDSCNGLIGQAWTIEALVQLGLQIDDQRLLDLAEQTFELHPFDSTFCGWYAVDIDGQQLGYHFTLNQQIWFAAVGAKIASVCNSRRIEEQVRKFLDALPSLMTRLPNGPIYHSVVPNSDFNKYVRYAVKNIQRRRIPDPLLHRLRSEYRTKIKRRSIGYHSFILYGLAMLHEEYPSHKFWKTDIIREVRDYTRSKEFLQATLDNKFCYTYNCTGIEVAYWEHEVWSESARVHKWASRQFEKCYNVETGLMDRSPHDPTTLAARIYEAIRLPDIEINIDT